MEPTEKLKPNVNPVIWGITAAIMVIALAAFFRINFGEEFTDQFFGFFWITVSMIQTAIWLKTKNPGYFTFMLVALLMGLSYLTNYKGIFIIIPGILLIAAHFYFIARKQMKWRFRNLLELAGRPVEETRDGFTARPYPSGKIEFDRNKLLQFGKFLSKNLIAFSIERDGGFYLLIKSSRGFWFKNPTIRNDTFIFFNQNGKVSVNITKADYEKFKEELTFDQLCLSLSNIFTDFWQLFNDGKKEKILERLDGSI